MDFGIGEAISRLFAVVGYLFCAIVYLIAVLIISHMNHDTWTHELIILFLVTLALWGGKKWVGRKL
tara:strand:+ start:819 stop:1016 length:198 start_codon:yes stop_codon:yes gene_type:complete